MLVKNRQAFFFCFILFFHSIRCSLLPFAPPFSRFLCLSIASSNTCDVVINISCEKSIQDGGIIRWHGNRRGLFFGARDCAVFRRCVPCQRGDIICVYVPSLRAVSCGGQTKDDAQRRACQIRRFSCGEHIFVRHACRRRFHHLFNDGHPPCVRACDDLACGAYRRVGHRKNPTSQRHSRAVDSADNSPRFCKTSNADSHPSFLDCKADNVQRS